VPKELFSLSSLYEQVSALNNNGLLLFKPKEIAYPELFLFYTCCVLLSSNKLSSEAVNSGAYSALTIPVQAARLFNLLSDVRKFDNNFIYECSDIKSLLSGLRCEVETELQIKVLADTRLERSSSNCKYLITDIATLQFQLKWVSDALNNLINAESDFARCDIIFNLLARFATRLPQSKREVVSVDSLRRVFDSSRSNTRIKGPRKLT